MEESADDARVAEEVEPAPPEEPREAFGLPFPPEVTHIKREPIAVRVSTPMTFEALQEFFTLRLPEYEFVRTNHSVHGLPLYSYLPEIFIFGRGGHRRGYRVVEYRVPRAWYHGDGKLEGADEKTLAMAQETRKVVRSWVDPGDSREPGQPVTLRSHDGELLAPGAKWGEPYVPPVGSYYHTERNRSNFGRPFGQWHPP